MKNTNAIVYMVIGVLVVLAVISVMKLGKVEGEVRKATNRILEGEAPKEQAPAKKPASSVSAGELARTLQAKMNDTPNIKSVQAEFYETT